VVDLFDLSCGYTIWADWNLSSTVLQHISDLQVWDYFQPMIRTAHLRAPTRDPRCHWGGLESLELQNSLSLMLHPSLRRAQIRRMGTAEYESKKEKDVVKRARHRKLQKLLRKHTSKLVQKLAEKVQGIWFS